MSAPATLTDLNDRIGEVVRLATTPLLLDEARKLCNDSGIAGHQRDLEQAIAAVKDGPDAVATARTALVTAQERERTARDVYDATLTEQEWLLDDRFVTEGNKTFLLYRRPAETDEEKAVADNGGKVEHRRQMTAEERATYKRLEARKHERVSRAEQELRAAEHDVAERRVDVDTAENRWQAARAVLDGARARADIAVAHLTVLGRALGGGT